MALPARALFRTDPASEGLVQRWYLPTRSARSWRPLEMTSAWQHQGVVTPQGRPYKGVAWYRVTLDWKEQEGAPVGMYVPDLRGSGLWLWRNGEFAGYLTPTDDPPVMDLTDRLQAGRNELVFRVDGSGGLGLPPFLFRSGAGRLSEVPVFPAEWLFRTDSQDQGQQQGWQRPDLDEAGWRAIPVGTNWEKTWVGDYDGFAWYRARFTIPGDLAGKKLVLRFGGVDEQAWVYLNGELVGEHTTTSTGQTVHQIWDKPFDLPLSNARTGQENVLAVRVHDSLAAGGIWKPVKLMVAGGGSG
jgi:beta-galactosidase/beta-glucuronidase